MIPFLKKNKDGKKPPKSTVPRTAQESIPFQRMFEDGTCRVRPGYYTRTIQYQWAPSRVLATELVLNSEKQSSTVYPTMLQIELMASPDIATFWRDRKSVV